MSADLRRAAEMRSRYLSEAVATASPAARLVMLVDALEMDLARVDNAFGEGRDLKLINDALIHAQNIIMTLRETLDVEVWEGAGKLQALYDFLYTELIHANIEKDRARAATVARYVGQLANAWRQAAVAIEASEPPDAP